MEKNQIAGQALIFYDSINDKYRIYHIHHQIQEELSQIIKFSEFSKFYHSYIRSKKVGRPYRTVEVRQWVIDRVP